MFFTSEENFVYFDQNYLGICWQLANNPRAFSYYDYYFNPQFFYDNPAYLNNAFDTQIISVQKNSAGGTDFVVNEQYKYQENIILNPKHPFYNDELYTDLFTDIYLNNSLVYSNHYLNSFNSLNDKVSIAFSSTEDPYQNNFKIRVENSSTYGYHETEILNVYSEIPTEVSVNFDNSYLVRDYFPVAYQDGTILYEEFTFIKLFPNDYNYPQNIKPLLFVNYDGLNNYPLSIDGLSSGEVNMTGVSSDSHDFNIDYKQYHDSCIFYINDYYYYDLEQKLTVKGVDQNSNTYNSFIIPWDYSDNLGMIDFQLQTTAYTPITFDFSMNFSNQQSLRGEGENSKYHFITTDQTYLGDYQCYLEFRIGDLSYPLSPEEIVGYLHYE